ncbi:hypothetical protein JYU34_014283 [Plutella xylostella]|uniref:Uncharacterized protein n=1 Tax=Plutella xylostella TaxID=51655 RepID=A0ABQ7Q7Y1_PLUXY|nr:hypothetical protein JYU34_014283 [Plutella xylostella]
MARLILFIALLLIAAAVVMADLPGGLKVPDLPKTDKLPDAAGKLGDATKNIPGLGGLI